MKCVTCQVNYENREQEDVADAEYVFAGRSLCKVHLNTRRDHAPDFERHDEPAPGSEQAIALATFLHLRDDHHNVLFKSDSVAQHREEYPDCDFVVLS